MADRAAGTGSPESDAPGTASSTTPPGRRERRPRWLDLWGGKWRSLAMDAALAAVTSGTANAEQVGGFPDWGRAAPLVGAVVFAALLVRRRFPWVALVTSTTLLIYPAALVSTYTVVSRRGPGRQALAAAALSSTLLIAHSVRDVQAANAFELVLLLAVFAVLIIVLPVVLGLWVHSRRHLIMTLRDRAEQAEREQDLLAERAVTGERRRIAREMHDVVAHRVSIISLQAGALTMTATDPKGAEIAEVIRTASATALTELREMLRALRDDPETPVEPAADQELSGVADLVASSAGAVVDLDLPDPLPTTSTAVGRAAYRVVQEAITNATKHAAGAKIRVEVAEHCGDLAVEVRNGPPQHRTGVEGSGYGLIGMRERVTLAGGTLQSGRTADGGYLVRAEFPCAAGLPGAAAPPGAAASAPE